MDIATKKQMAAFMCGKKDFSAALCSANVRLQKDYNFPKKKGAVSSSGRVLQSENMV